MTFTGLTEEICEAAWNLVLPSIKQAAEAGIINKLAGTIVVLNPVNGELLFTAPVVDRAPDFIGYDEIAKAKAKICWETGLTSRQVQQDAPHLYQPGWTKWGGGVVENRLVVAFSGVEAVFDEAISWMVLNWILAMCQHEMTKPDGVMQSGKSYIGE